MKVSTPITFDTLRAAASATTSTRQLIHHPLSSATPNQDTKKVKFNVRSHVMQLGALSGQLCHSILTHAPMDSSNSDFWIGGVGESNRHHNEGKEEIASSMGILLLALLVTAKACALDLRVCILKKIELNGRKYPVELCKGKSGKYTAYSHKTGITKDNQSTLDSYNHSSSSSDEHKDTKNQNPLQTIEEVTQLIRKFATDRKWSKYHTPRNIVLALLGEVGELAELFQWRGDEEETTPPPSPTSSSCSSSLDDDDEMLEESIRESGLSGWTEDEIDKVGQELADVSIYLLRLADVCHVNVGEAALCVAEKLSSSS